MAGRLRRLFAAFDALAARHGVRPVDVIGDAYLTGESPRPTWTSRCPPGPLRRGRQRRHARDGPGRSRRPRHRRRRDPARARGDPIGPAVAGSACAGVGNCAARSPAVRATEGGASERRRDVRRRLRSLAKHDTMPSTTSAADAAFAHSRSMTRCPLRLAPRSPSFPPMFATSRASFP